MANVDLNLVAYLHALLDERNVTRAAVRVGLSQPAMSNALGRLRRRLGDPLLVRQGNTMHLTPLARELLPAAAEVVASLDRMFEPREGSAGGAFDVRLVDRTLRLVMTDHVVLTMLPQLCRAVAERAPSVTVDVVSSVDGDEAHRLVRAGDVDLAVGTFGEIGDRMHRRHLFHEAICALMAASNPAVEQLDPSSGAMSVESYLAADHVAVAPRLGGIGTLPTQLAELGLERHVVCVVPDLLAIPFVIEDSQLVAALPARVGRRFASSLGLQVAEPPLPAAGFDVEMLWSARTGNDPLHRWLRALLLEIARGLSGYNRIQ